MCRSIAPRSRAKRQPEISGGALAHHQKPLGAGARHDAVEQPQRIGDQARVEILVERQRLLEQRQRIFQRVVALRDAELAEIFALARRRLRM